MESCVRKSSEGGSIITEVINNVTTIKCHQSDTGTLSNSISFRSTDPSHVSDKIVSSRCENEFEDIEKIGEGGFGRVYKATHRIDGMQYAIKKIKLGKDNLNGADREVKIMAMMSHPNVVAYKTSWIETWLGNALGSSTSSMSAGFSSPYSLINSSNHFSDGKLSGSGAGKNPYGSNISSPTELTWASSSKDSKEHSSPILLEILHIQMSFYVETLDVWLGKRNADFHKIKDYIRKNTIFITQEEDLDVVNALQIYLGILKGVSYIHKLGIIHHDLKPANIFLDGRTNCSKYFGQGSQVKVGDFGLACCQHRTSTSNSLDYTGCEIKNQRHAKKGFFKGICSSEKKEPLGTKLYAAPEQLRGWCHSKNDMFSLGIILVELLVPFNTKMERGNLLLKIRRNANVIPDFKDPRLTEIIKVLLGDVKRRPNLKTLQYVIQSTVREKTGRKGQSKRPFIFAKLLRKPDLGRSASVHQQVPIYLRKKK